MFIISCIVFALSASLDALAVGISYAFSKIIISLFQNIIISFFAMLGTFLSLQAGSLLTELINPNLLCILGHLSILLLGIYYCAKGLRNMLRPKTTDKNIPNDKTTRLLSLKELFILCILLSVNNVGIGISASLTQINPCLASALTFIFSYIFIFIGNQIPIFRSLSDKSYLSDLFAGILLVFLGILKY